MNTPEYNRDYYNKNKEKISKHRKNWYLINREKVLEKQRLEKIRKAELKKRVQEMRRESFA